MANGQGGRQDPFEALRKLGDLKDIQKLLGADFFRSLPVPGFSEEDEAEPQFPAVDLYDVGDSFVVQIEVPGLKGPEIGVSASPYELAIRGYVPPPVGRRDSGTLAQERFSGPFERRVELPVRVQTDSVHAACRQGLLVVTLTKESAADGEGDLSVPIGDDE